MLKHKPLLVFTFVALFSVTSYDNLKEEPAKESKKNKLEQIKQEGVLHVVTRVDPTTYYPLPEGGFSGLEYDLVMLFAKQLGVKVKFQVPKRFNEILQKTAEGKIDIAVAGLTITKERKKILRFAPSYYKITEQLIYRSGTSQPKSPEDLQRGILEVTKGTSHVNSLQTLIS